jgi:hypothetical protein
MRERPISFSAPMVRALLVGAKTQARCVIRPQPSGSFLGLLKRPLRNKQESLVLRAWFQAGSGEHHSREVTCPYGQPGDRLWVREFFCGDGAHDHLPPSELPPTYAIRYEADGFVRAGLGEADGKRRPPTVMLRRLSRITLELTGMRVERLQDISEADAIAEGIERHRGNWRCYTDANAGVACRFPVNSYRTLWESINGAGSWDANPWVWVLEFKRLDEMATRADA